MKHHTLKIHPLYADEVRAGRKTFEVRYDDRNYQVGDTVGFNEVCLGEFISQLPTRYEITYVLRGMEGLQTGWCAFAMRPLNEGGEA